MDGIGLTIFESLKSEVDQLWQQHRPEVVVQIEGRSLFGAQLSDCYCYYVSEDANVMSCGWTVEAEQGLLPFRDQSVDLLIINHAIELYDGLDGLIRECERVLSPSGRIYIAVLLDRWLGVGIATEFYPMGSIRLTPESLRRVKQSLGRYNLEIVSSRSLMSNTEAAMIVQRLKETLIHPMGFEVMRLEPKWSGYVGAI